MTPNRKLCRHHRFKAGDIVQLRIPHELLHSANESWQKVLLKIKSTDWGRISLNRISDDEYGIVLYQHFNLIFR